MDKITVKCTPHPDPKLKGLCRVRKPWAVNRFFTEKAEEVELTRQNRAAVLRMIAQGDLVETKDEPVDTDPRRLPMPPEKSPADDFKVSMHGEKED